MPGALFAGHTGCGTGSRLHRFSVVTGELYVQPSEKLASDVVRALEQFGVQEVKRLPAGDKPPSLITASVGSS